MSLPEILLWQRLKGSPQGIAFRKQHPIAGYRADFYCAAAKLIIEVDGAAHDMGDRPERDVERTKILETKGIEWSALLLSTSCVTLMKLRNRSCRLWPTPSTTPPARSPSP